MKKLFLKLTALIIRFKSFKFKGISNILQLISIILSVGGVGFGTNYYINNVITNNSTNQETKDSIVSDKERHDNIREDTLQIKKPILKKPVDKRTLLFKDAFSKVLNKTTISFLIKNKEQQKIDHNLQQKLSNILISNSKYAIASIFKDEVLAHYNDFYAANPSFLKLTKIQSYTDLYIIGEISEKTKQSPASKRMKTTNLNFNGLLIDIKSNNIIPLNLGNIKGTGFSEDASIENAYEDLIDTLIIQITNKINSL